ncbi:MAG: LytTR family DNA-binding domain-containing protein, partial [Flavobacterium sp.]
NKQLNKYQEKLQDLPEVPTAVPGEPAKKRIITYHKDELVKLETHEIAYIFLDNGITHIYTFEERQYTSNNSLDEIMKGLDSSIFYRANRQFIINIEVIQTILLYGKNQLKLKLKTAINTDIIISKNKVSEFKQWLDQ